MAGTRSSDPAIKVQLGAALSVDLDVAWPAACFEAILVPETAYHQGNRTQVHYEHLTTWCPAELHAKHKSPWISRICLHFGYKLINMGYCSSDNLSRRGWAIVIFTGARYFYYGGSEKH